MTIVFARKMVRILSYAQNNERTTPAAPRPPRVATTMTSRRLRARFCHGGTASGVSSDCRERRLVRLGSRSVELDSSDSVATKITSWRLARLGPHSACVRSIGLAAAHPSRAHRGRRVVPPRRRLLDDRKPERSRQGCRSYQGLCDSIEFILHSPGRRRDVPGSRRDDPGA